MGNDDHRDRCCMPLPPGFRFRPTDEELLTHYLARKAADAGFAPSAFRDVVDLYKAEPWDLLPPGSDVDGEDGYFFCARRVKFPSGLRANRATRAGYWKSTGKDKLVLRHDDGSGAPLGVKKTLVFYRGRAPRGRKTGWVMHEYRLVEGQYDTASSRTFARGGAQIEWVICRMFTKKPAATGGASQEERETILHPSSLDDHVQISTDGSKAPAPPAAGSGSEQQANFCFLFDAKEMALGDHGHEKSQGSLQLNSEEFLVNCRRELEDLLSSSAFAQQATLVGEELAADSSFDLPQLLDYEGFPFVHDF